MGFKTLFLFFWLFAIAFPSYTHAQELPACADQPFNIVDQNGAVLTTGNLHIDANGNLVVTVANRAAVAGLIIQAGTCQQSYEPTASSLIFQRGCFNCNANGQITILMVAITNTIPPFTVAQPAITFTACCAPDCLIQPFQLINGTTPVATGTISVNQDGQLVIQITDQLVPISRLEITFGDCPVQIFEPVTIPLITSFPLDCFDCPSTTNASITFVVSTPTVTPSPFTQLVSYNPCCTPVPNCVHTADYWATHNNFEKKRCNKIAWPTSDDTTLIAENTILCEKTWLQILKTPASKSAWYALAHQWIAAKLNEAAGVVIPMEIQTALAQAEALLLECNLKAKKSDLYERLTEVLCLFNAGTVEGYPPACCCCLLLPDADCVHTVQFWKTHNSFEKKRCNQVNWPQLTETFAITENTILCNRTWIDIIQSPAKTAWEKLAQQWIAAQLNQANGVTISPDIANVIDQAGELLSACHTHDKKCGNYEVLEDILCRFNSGALSETGLNRYPPRCCSCECP